MLFFVNIMSDDKCLTEAYANTLNSTAYKVWYYFEIKWNKIDLLINQRTAMKKLGEKITSRHMSLILFFFIICLIKYLVNRKDIQINQSREWSKPQKERTHTNINSITMKTRTGKQ